MKLVKLTTRLTNATYLRCYSKPSKELNPLSENCKILLIYVYWEKQILVSIFNGNFSVIYLIPWRYLYN